MLPGWSAGEPRPKKEPPGRSDPTGRSTGRDSEVTRPRRRQDGAAGFHPEGVDPSSNMPRSPKGLIPGPWSGDRSHPFPSSRPCIRPFMERSAAFRGRSTPFRVFWPLFLANSAQKASISYRKPSISGPQGGRLDSTGFEVAGQRVEAAKLAKIVKPYMAMTYG